MNILIFNFLCLLRVSNQRVQLQKDGCINGYGMGCFTCISIILKMITRVRNMQKT